MRVRVESAALSGAVATVSRAIRPGVEVLQGVQLVAGQGSVLVTGTDVDLTIRVRVPATVLAPGRAVLGKAKTVARTLRLLSGELTVATDEHAILVTDAEATYRLPAVAAEEFPLIEDCAETSELDAGALAGVLDFVLPCASRDESRPVLCGVQLAVEDERVRAVATDSYRLAVDCRDAEATGPPFVALVQARALGELRRLIPRKADGLRVAVGGDGRVWTFRVGDAEVQARAVDGEYPDWRGLRPASFEFEVELETAPVVRVLERLRPLLDADRPVRVTFGGDGTVTLAAGETTVTLKERARPTGGDGPPAGFEIGFTPAFLVEALTASQPTARVRLLSPLRPALFVNGSEESWHLLMPRR